MLSTTHIRLFCHPENKKISFTCVCATNELSLEDVSGPFCATDKQQQQHNHIKGNVHIPKKLQNHSYVTISRRIKDNIF